MEEFKESKKEEEGCLEKPSAWAKEMEEAHRKDWSDEVKEEKCNGVKKFGLWTCFTKECKLRKQTKEDNLTFVI